MDLGDIFGSIPSPLFPVPQLEEPHLEAGFGDLGHVVVHPQPQVTHADIEPLRLPVLSVLPVFRAE